MNPHNPQANALQLRSSRFRRRLPGPLGPVCLVLAFLCGPVQALYTQDAVTAYRVPDGKIRVDGNPERLWRALSLQSGAVATIAFTDMGKLVLLQPQQVRNANPSLYVKNPVNGYVSMLAAYDNAALYFLFLVKTATVVNSKTVCGGGDNLWKADAPEVFLDPNVWMNDSTSYRKYFSTDASGLIFGSSPKTIQLSKPLNDKDTRSFFRNRAMGDRFQVAALPAGASVVSLRSPSDTALVAVEMRIPYWGGLSTSYSPAKSLFISWGFNMYPESLWTNCNGNPLAYRWAKHYLNYDGAAVVPPGWAAHDSTHFDPTRSWDGWGRFNLSAAATVDSTLCSNSPASEWNPTRWSQTCIASVTILEVPAPGARLRWGRGGLGVFGGSGHARDMRGRSLKDGYILRILPWGAAENAGPPGDG